MVEQGTHKPLVGSPNLPLGTNKNPPFSGFLLLSFNMELLPYNLFHMININEQGILCPLTIISDSVCGFAKADGYHFFVFGLVLFARVICTFTS